MFALMLFAGVAAVVAAADDTEKKAVTNKLCPVSGGASSEKYRAEYKGQYVYVCCEGCVNDFKKSPETFVANVQGRTRLDSDQRNMPGIKRADRQSEIG